MEIEVLGVGCDCDKNFEGSHKVGPGEINTPYVMQHYNSGDGIITSLAESIT